MEQIEQNKQSPENINNNENIKDNNTNNTTNADNINNDDINNTVIGIDLGTRFSCVSIWRNKRFEIIPDHFGNRTIPSVVAFFRSARLVGYNALSMKDVNPKNTIYDIKRIIGRRMDDPVIDQISKLISYQLIDDQSVHKNILVQLDTTDITINHKKQYRPEEICAYILIELKRIANNYLQNPNINKAVITVPAYFNDAQRQATLDAATIAGLDVIKIINEPTAAALAYGLGNKASGNVLIYDFGAGTLDVSLININNGTFKVMAVGGNMHLGGEDIDYLIMNHLIIDFQKNNKLRDIHISKLTQLKLKNSVENAKKILSTNDKAIICVPDFCQGKQLYFVLSREMFELICNELFIMAMKPIHDVLESANMNKTDIDDVVLVGGSTRIPKVQELILNYFKDCEKVQQLITSLNPDEVVSAGASIYGYIMMHREDPFSENIVLLDITPLSLGIETLQKQMTTIIPRNTVIPTKKTKIFSTDTDDQDSVNIKIFEGERDLTKHNFHVGTFELTNFAKGPRGYPVISITFNIDINGILHVTAHEKKSNAQNTITITSTWGAKGRLSKSEIDNIISEAAKNKQFDMLYSTKIGLINNIQNICNSIMINLNDDAFNLTHADKKKIKQDVKNNLKWLNETDQNSLEILELESREKRLSKLYSPLIAQVNKSRDKFENNVKEIESAEVHGDDEDNNNTKYEKIEIKLDPSEYDKEEIKQLKKSITELCNNIVNVVNNPVSKFTSEDIELVTDYISTVNIWLYTTSATTTIEFIAKINEVNKFTEDIMQKYIDKPIFENNDRFSVRDELQLTCLTLNNSLKSNYFSLKKDETNTLLTLINDTMIWLIQNQNETAEVYKEKITKINEVCNQFHNNMHKIPTLESIPNNDLDSDSEDDEPIPEINTKNKIKEDIDDIINKMKPTEVLLKIDVARLSGTKYFR